MLGWFVAAVVVGAVIWFDPVSRFGGHPARLPAPADAMAIVGFGDAPQSDAPVAEIVVDASPQISVPPDDAAPPEIDAADLALYTVADVL